MEKQFIDIDQLLEETSCSQEENLHYPLIHVEIDTFLEMTRNL